MSEAEAANAAETVEEVEAKGFFGEADPRDRNEYALTTGPESPSALEATLDAKKAELEAQTEELATRAQGAKTKASEAKSSRPTRHAEGA